MQINGFLMNQKVPKVMGILNITPDSFYAESRLSSESDLIKQAEKQLSEGASILDLGGMSTRANAKLIDEKEEIQKIQTALRSVKNHFPEAILSVDTFRASVAQMAIDEGVSIINDISGFQFDSKMLDVLAVNPEIVYILMHVEGTFETMHQVTKNRDIAISQYDDITQKVAAYFQEKITFLNERSISNIILDPGFGFSKTLDENYQLLRGLNSFQSFDKPIMAGVSRKSMIYKKLGIQPEESLNGTTVINTVAYLNGTSIFRVHDVKACKEMLQLLA